MLDPACCQIDADLIAFVHRFVQGRALDNRQTVIDGISVKRACERACDHSLDAETLNSGRGLLARATAPKIPPGHQDVKTPKLLPKALAQHLESVLAEPLFVDIDQISAGNNHIGINVVA